MKNPLQILTLKALPAVALAVLAIAPAGVSAQSDDLLKLDIKPQEAGSALVTLARSSGVQIMLAEGDGAKVEVEGLKGEYRLEEALAALLTDTGLEYEFASENLIVVQEVDQAAEPEAEDEASAEDEDAEEKEEPIELATQVVTGSRIKGGDPTARVVSITAEEIAVRGVSDLEELFRTLPWAFPSITTQTNTSAAGVNAADTDKQLNIYGLGISTVNLRAMGSAYTLVLINGRRVAGAGGHEENFTNLLNVPISAIERVDVQLGGGSAVYGADAVGGVVNFILKKGYRGLSATARREYSSSGADRDRLSLQSGYGWDSGSLSFNLSRNKTTAIDNAKTGWTSFDYRDQFGPEYDLRNYGVGQPGVACQLRYPDRPYSYVVPRCDGNSPARYQLSADHSGLGATVDDFATNIRPHDSVAPRNGSDSTNTSFTMHVEQYMTDDLLIYADVLYSKLFSFQEQTSIISAIVPASNAYSPFDRTMIVTYWPGAEVEAGLIPRPYLDGETKQQNYSLGAVWSFRGHELELGLTRSVARHHTFDTSVDNYRPRGDPTAEKYYAALESSDPSRALNLFGDGSAQGELFDELFSISSGRRGTTERTSVEPLLRGQLFQVWGGAINYALGAELRKDVIYSHMEYYGEDGLEIEFSSEDLTADARPSYKLRAYFAELAIPLVGENNARPGLHSLVLNLQARNDSYASAGFSGRDYNSRIVSKVVYMSNLGWTEYDDYASEYFGPLDRIKNKKSATSPRIGLLYKPVESLGVRASWSRSFRPPDYSDIYNAFSGSVYTWGETDVAHPSGMPVYVPSVPHIAFRVDPDLESEFSDNYSLSFDWSPQSLPGFRWTIDWSRIDFTNRIEYAYDILRADKESAYRHPKIVRRDADGNITSIFWGDVNIAAKISETVETGLQYAFETRLGSFSSRLNYARVLEEIYQITVNSTPTDRKGTAAGSSEYRLTGSVSWTRGNLAVDAFVYHTPSYRNNRIGARCRTAVGGCERSGGPLPDLMVDSLTTVDLAVTYRFDNGLRLRGGGRNVFKATAPTVWQGRPYDPTRWDARGQVLYLELNWEM